MGFDVKAFSKAKLQLREKDVLLTDTLLKDFFGDGEEHVWKVRALTGYELGYINESNNKAKTIADLVGLLASRYSPEIADSLREVLGLDPKVTPEETSKRLETLVIGSVDPVCTMDLAIKVCHYFAIEFKLLTDWIWLLTGQGSVQGKPPGSGETPPAEPV